MGEEELEHLATFDPVDLLDRGTDLQEEEEVGEAVLQLEDLEEEQVDTVDLLVKVEDLMVDSVLQEELHTVEEEEDLPLGTKSNKLQLSTLSTLSTLFSPFQHLCPLLSTPFLSTPLYPSRISTLDSLLLPFAPLVFFDFVSSASPGTMTPTETYSSKTTHPRINPLSPSLLFMDDSFETTVFTGHLNWFPTPSSSPLPLAL